MIHIIVCDIMKKITIIFIGLFLITQFAFSQNFISEDKQWNVKEDFWGYIHMEIFKIDGDTTINSITYQKVWRSFDSTLVEWWPMAYIREESNIVYMRNYDNEGILYDFNLVTGDTAYITSAFCEEMQIVIYDIDTINYLGNDRKRWALDEYGFEYWLEGIGSTLGLLYSQYYKCSADLQFSLLCFYQNDTLQYIKDGEDDCFQSSVGMADNPDLKTQIIISPNPATTNITISIPTIANATNTIVSIYNVNARQVISRRLTEPITVLDIGTLPGGLYFARVTNDRTVMVGKFVKE